MSRVPKLFNDPLAHFLIAGAALVWLGGLVAPPEPAENRIVVNRQALLEFIQYRSKAFEPGAAAALLDSMDEERRQRLVKDFLEEEILYRQAKELGLDANDYVIKQRLVQKLGFITEASIGDLQPSDEEIAAHYEANKEAYRIPASATFAHVFFSAEKRGVEAAYDEAAKTVAALNEAQAPFEDAVRHGDRFPFHTNYVERTFEYVAAQLGETAAVEIFDSQGPFETWRGPVVSPYGAHAFFVSEATPGKTPPLEEIRDRVAVDAAREKKAEMTRRLLESAIAQYDVIVDLDAPEAPGGGGEKAAAR